MKSTVTTDQWRELLVREARGDFGWEGLGLDLQWFADHWQNVRDLRMRQLKLAPHYPCQINCPELIPQDDKGRPWDVVEDIIPTITSVANLDFISHLNEGESRTNGKEFRRRAVSLHANYGLSDAKFLLEHQAEIPESIRGKLIVLTGTVLRSNYPDGKLLVVYLRWEGGQWVLRKNLVDTGFSNIFILPRGKSIK